ncbi:MAG: DNA recombination protein RmuC [Gammaproteobacteria bacterium]|nr:DNA recombination protein RmuC [Gammaproteobacteria bacterium]
MFKETSEQLKAEFQLLAQRIFEEHGETFARNNRTQIDGLLTPFREQLSEFKLKVEQVYVTESKDRASLLNEVRNLQRASERINEEAEGLARALKGDKKIQGNWGELVLERVLDSSGLRRDHEYSVQAARRSESGEANDPTSSFTCPTTRTSSSTRRYRSSRTSVRWLARTRQNGSG